MVYRVQIIVEPEWHSRRVLAVNERFAEAFLNAATSKRRKTPTHPSIPIALLQAALCCTPHRPQRTAALCGDQPPVPLVLSPARLRCRKRPSRSLRPRFVHFTQAPRFAELAAETNRTPHHRSLAQPTGNEATPPHTNTLEWHHPRRKFLGNIAASSRLRIPQVPETPSLSHSPAEIHGEVANDAAFPPNRFDLLAHPRTATS